MSNNIVGSDVSCIESIGYGNTIINCIFVGNNIKIGNNNTIKNAVIAEGSEITDSYIEDCLGHLKTMEDLLNVSLGNLKNAELKNFVSQELKNTRKQEDDLFLMSFFRIDATSKIIINEGKTTPSVATNAPKNPPSEYPIKVAILIAIGPGVDSLIPKKS